ncbi:ROK family protein [Klebsiella aerogenes]|uniref:ROK family protein n=1 Tax=Klebsiella aerogenes TaxID=548 RepID=UPI00063C9A45|nr:ROK family protein [Klebsiella aerogenes]KAA0471574.1 ROK family protein [Klebsiella aerogenes]KLF27083.1 ROK family protein [Klebsiella aerogenes]HBR6965468.1 ROK family protein [Klebsiella aerogenes]HCU1807806.1 ROK family protein [Klebsiella aerogenes]HDT4028551.1 ROK family protein [Klebsiella aerogenes]
MSNSVLCLDIGGSFIKSAVSPAPGQLVMPRQRAMPLSSWPAFVYAVEEIIAQYGDAISEQSPLALSCAGVVDVANDRILSSNIPPFAGIDITQSLQTELGRPVAMANDADCFTLAEARFGAAKDLPVVLGVILGSGIGGGIAINGNILYGNQGIGAEWGHGPITRTHLRGIELPRLACGCGQQGCLDTLGGAKGMQRLHQLLSGQALSSVEIVKQGMAGEETAAFTLEVWLELVSEPLAHTVNILGPHKIVAGGGLAGETALLARLDTALRAKILLKSAEPLLVAGQFSREGGLLGASVLGWEKF